MDQNAEMIIARHRALFSKPGELGKTVKLGIKRSAKTRQSVEKITAMTLMPVASAFKLVNAMHE